MSEAKQLIQMEGEERRVEIVAMYKAGYKQAEIGEALGITQETVSRQLAKQREIWVNSALMDFHEAQGQALERIDKIEIQAQEGWERSLKPLVMQIRYRDKNGDMVDQLRQSNRDGDPRFLQTLAWCVEQRCKILGLTISKHEVTRTEVQRITLVEVLRPTVKQHDKKTLHD